MSENQNAGQKERLWSRSFVGISIVNLTMFVGFQMMNTTFTLFIIQLGGDVAIAGVVAGFFSAASVLSRPFLGWLLDYLGRWRILLLGMAGFLLFPVGFSFIKVLGLCIVLRILFGFVWSGASTAANTVACDVIPRSRFGQGMSIFGTGPALAMALGPLMGVFLWDHSGSQMLFLCAAAFALLALLLALLVFFDQKRRGVKQATKAGRLDLRNIIDKNALPASITLLLSNVPYGAITAFIAVYALGTNIGSSSLFFALIAGATIVTRLLFGGFADKHGEDPVVFISLACLLLGLVLLSISKTSISFYASAVIYGLGFGMFPPTMQAMAMRNAPPERRGAASSTFLIAFDLGIGAGGLIAGFLIKYLGYALTFSLMIIFVLVSFVLYLLWARRRSGVCIKPQKSDAE